MARPKSQPPAVSIRIAVAVGAIAMMATACGSTPTATNRSPAGVTTASPSPAPKTYHYVAEGASFTYPGSWTLSEVTKTDMQGNQYVDASVTSPDHKFRVEFSRKTFNGIGGACPQPTCAMHVRDHLVVSGTPVTLAGAGEASQDSGVTDGAKIVDAVGLSDDSFIAAVRPGTTVYDAAIMPLTFASRKPVPQDQGLASVAFTGCYIDSSGSCLPMPPASFFADPDEAAAEQILKSLSYP